MLIAASRKEKVEDRVAIAEAAGLKPRVMDVESLRDAGGLPADRAVAAGERPRPEHRPGRHRRPRHPFLRPAQRPVPVLPRPGVRRQPADPGHPARVQPLARGGRVGQEEPGAAGELRQPTCCSRSWKRWRSRSPGRCSSSSRRPRTTRSTRSCWPAAARCCPGLDELVAKRAGVATVVANPFATMQASERIRPRQLAQDAPLLLIAMRPRDAELRVMIRINLLPHREQKRQARQRQFVSLAIGLAVAGRSPWSASSTCILASADRQPDRPQQAPQGRDRQARRADQGDRPAARPDRRRCSRASRWSRRCRPTAPRPSTCSTSWCGSCRTASTCESLQAGRAQGHDRSAMRSRTRGSRR